MSTPKLTLEQQLAAALAENAKLKAIQPTAKSLSMKITDKGGISVYGMGRFPVTLYPTQWVALNEAMPTILKAIEENAELLAERGEASKAAKALAKTTVPVTNSRVAFIGGR